MTFMLIPAGTFTMGSPATESGRGPSYRCGTNWCSTDETQHQVTISKPFYLSKYEMTQQQWQAINSYVTNGCNEQKGGSEGPQFPAHTMNWYDAKACCDKIATKTGRACRIPTESEWEYACRAGTTTEWFWGDDGSKMNDYAMTHNNQWYGDNKHPATIGQLKPNQWGVYDIIGNISEWTADWYGDYPKDSVTDPTGPSTGALKVTRGCSYDCGGSVRTAARDAEDPSITACLEWFYGLRPVLEADATNSKINYLLRTHGFFAFGVKGTAALQFRYDANMRNGLIKIYASSGKLVRTLTATGPNVSWNGNDFAGRKVSAGTYLVRLVSGNSTLGTRLFQVCY